MSLTRAHRRWAWTAAGVARTVGVLAAGTGAADDKKPSYPKPPAAANVKVIPDAWKTTPREPLTAEQLDQLITQALKSADLSPAPLTTDEEFIRRVFLDLTGTLPSVAEVEKFAASKDPRKRAELIDRLLAGDAFPRHWARSWRAVVAARGTNNIARRLGGPFETWLAEQLQANRSWADITRDIITAQGELRFDPRAEQQSGATYFLLLHTGPEAINERAAETSRVFLGIQIQCAQCHDHPSDIWKREQFHQFAAYFARVRDRLVREEDRFVGIALFALPRGEHFMPDPENPRRGTPMSPRFLTGEALRPGTPDADRRKALADLITSKDNYWFAAAFVNRTWGELMGQSFYQPVDNLGPLQEATFPEVLLRLAAAFQASGYDIRGLYRTIMNSQTYQRKIRLGDDPGAHVRFAGAYPSRLRADSLWESLVAVLGPMPGGRPGFGPPGGGPGGFNRFGLRGVFMETFDFDPSTKADEVEGSVPQALLLMNNPQIHARIRATGDTLLARVLRAHANDAEAVKAVYMHALARKPSERELAVCLDYIKKVGRRAEAFEDILWSLINSTEFQTRR